MHDTHRGETASTPEASHRTAMLAMKVTPKTPGPRAMRDKTPPDHPPRRAGGWGMGEVGESHWNWKCEPIRV